MSPQTSPISDAVIRRRDGPALFLGIHRPHDGNRVDSACMKALVDGLDFADADPAIRVVVLAGSREFFCTGGRIDGHPNGTVEQQLGFGRAFCELQRRMGQTRAPILAAVQGLCTAGGMSLLAACDLAVASSDAQFGFPEIEHGLFPMLAMAVAQGRLPDKLLFEMFYTGRRLQAEEARLLHLVNEVVEPGQFDQAVARCIDGLAARSATAMALGRKAYYAMAPMTLEARLDYAQTMLTAMLAASRGAGPPLPDV